MGPSLYIATAILVLGVATTASEGTLGESTTEVATQNGQTGAEVVTVRNTTNVQLATLPTRIVIGSFNMKQFGTKKANNRNVLEILAKIVTRYDILALQEITDSKLNVMKKLMGAVIRETSISYDYVLSERVGRTNQKEQYALIYRTHVLEVTAQLMYDDTVGDPFSREPHIIEARLIGNGERIAIINVHVAPGDAPAEIDSLTDVHAWVEEHLSLQNIIILGDLNADCSYIRRKDRPNIRLLNSKKFLWLIPDIFDTTVGATDCAYDRIILSGPYLTRSWIKGSPEVFEFDLVFGLSKQFALNVSDHFPVEFALRVDSSRQYMQADSSASQYLLSDVVLCATVVGIALTMAEILQ